MSKIDELIQEFCPNGVKFLQLGDVAQILNGYSFKSGKYSESGIRVVRISDVQKGKMSDKDLKFYPLEYEAEISRYLLRENDLVMSLTGNVGRVAMLSKTDLPAGLNQRVACIRPSEIVLTRWLFHFLDTDTFESDAMKNSTGGGQKNMSTVWLSKYKIPVPPLEVQKEIVNILDKFTELEAELSAELDARRKQYEYYRNQLLTFDKSGSDVKWLTLDKIATNLDSKRKPVTRGARTSGEIPYYGASGIVDYVQDYIFDGDYLLVSEDGANLLARSTPIAFSISGKTWVNNHAHVLEFNEYATRRLVEIYLNSIDLRPYVTGGAQPKLNKANLNKITIPIPSLEDQKRIVTILDKFDKLVTSISEGLPAEIEARRQQYEYYRTKLLTFQELSA